jgi:VanZ family protein
MAVALASAYGITDELHQLFVPGRVSDPVDWLVDTLGAIVGVYVATRIYRAWSSRKDSPRA